MAKSMEDVLSDVDASEQVENEQTEIVEPDQDSPEPDQASQDEDPQGAEDEGGDRNERAALHAERQRVKRKYTETVADFEKKLAENNSSFEKKLSESLAQNDAKWEQRFNQFAQGFQQPPRHDPEQQQAPDPFEDLTGFVSHETKQALNPVQGEVQQLREFYSQQFAAQRFGAESVIHAYKAMDEALRSRNPEAKAALERIKSSMDPYGDMVTWHKRQSVLAEVGSDPDAYRKKIREEALNDPEYLAMAIEKAKGAAQPAPATQKQSNITALPSLNRTTAAADDADEPEDPGEVFNAALRSGRRA